MFILYERKVYTVREFYKVFHNMNILSIYICMICYRKYIKGELEDISWNRWMVNLVEKSGNLSFGYYKCFLVI